MSFRSKEQAAYAQLIESALGAGPPLLAGAAAGLGKTHGYSVPLVRSGKRVAVSMSTRQLIDQFLDSDALRAAREGRDATVVALQPRRHFDSAVDYRAHREQALQAQVLVVTHAAAFIDSLNPGYADLREREVVLFDEADLLADAADLRSTFAIDPVVLRNCGAEGLPPTQAAQRVRERTDDPEDRAAAAAILHALERPAWYKVVGHDESGNLTLRHRMPGRMLRPLVRDTARCIFTSGTLQVFGRFDHFVRALGLTAVAPESRHIDPVQHGALVVDVAADELNDMEVALRVARARRPVLVLTTSHEITQRLAALLPEATARGRDESLADAVNRCPDDGILIAAGAWSGLDAPRLRWKTVAIPKTPYGVPIKVDGASLSSYIDSQVVAIRRTNQGLHRGLRTTDAHCTLLLLDPRSSRDALRQAIPSRFVVDWTGFDEGSQVLITHTSGERDASLREAALNHHGPRCMWPGCEVEQRHLLEVHHLKPIAEGQRRTRFADVQVLCRNHHAEAHHQMRQAILGGAEDRISDD